MQWKTRKQERKKRKRRGLAKTLGAVTAVGSSLGLGSLINTDTSDVSSLNNKITQLNKDIKEEIEKTKQAQQEAEAQKQVNTREYESKCDQVVSKPNTKK